MGSCNYIVKKKVRNILKRWLFINFTYRLGIMYFDRVRIMVLMLYKRDMTINECDFTLFP